MDQADLLRPEQEVELTSRLEALYSQTGRQFVIATVKDLQGYPIDDYGYRLGRYWKIGDEKRDDGVILLVAPAERQVDIETGYGAEVFLPDALSGRIIREAILPRFKAGDMGGGIVAGADEIIKQMGLPPEEAQKNVAAAKQTEEKRRHSSGGALPGIFWFMIIGFVALSMFRRAAGRRYYRRSGISPWVVLWGLNELSRGSRGGGSWGGGSWGGGGSSWGGGGGGGFGGFSGGGGSFGGGGASGSW